MTLLIYRGNRPSEGARNLRALLRSGMPVRINRLGASLPSYTALLNWGCSVTPTAGIVLNAGHAVSTAINKLTAFRSLTAQNVPVPQFTMDKPVAQRWLEQGRIVLARSTLTGSGGEGITVVRPGDSLPDAPLYVHYVRKLTELRLHVFKGRVIAAQQKRKRNGADQSADEALIRNYSNGWVFCVHSLSQEQAERAGPVAVAAVAALGLDFGAVDMVINRDSGDPCVLEVNTAPGLTSPTVLGAYAEAIKEWWHGRES